MTPMSSAYLLQKAVRGLAHSLIGSLGSQEWAKASSMLQHLHPSLSSCRSGYAIVDEEENMQGTHALAAQAADDAADEVQQVSACLRQVTRAGRHADDLHAARVHVLDHVRVLLLPHLNARHQQVVYHLLR